MNTTTESQTPDRPASGQGAPAYAEVPHSHYDLFVGVFVALLLLSGITAAKLFEGPVVPLVSDLFYGGGPLIFDGGAFLFPFVYIIGDILAEVYGWRRARRAIVLGFAMLGLAAVTYQVVALTTPVEGFEVWDQALAPVLRITLAGLAAFLVGSLLNATIVVRMKRRMRERNVALRLILSTIVGQFVDTLIFCTIAFAGTIGLLEFVNYTVTGFVYKTLLEILLVPVTVAIIAWLKRREPTYRRADEPTSPAAARAA
ncbi:putative integral membrane protein (TIGR00697 family) [Micrococcus cohnii]|uniref:Probable queuosine precursor transporter n=1 Tax=Micrococcus cohnii TaxID=993416 RepID=A0A7W7M446_9MICC|nr:putative integral membrane protein (TIGR00697 family) [Micrococcus cohnii]